MSIEISDASARDLPAIVEIHNHAVRATTAAWSHHEVDLADRRAWLADKHAKGFPVLAARRDGELLGFAAYGPFRALDGYRRTVEDSIYVREGLQRQGVGRALLSELVARARAQNLHVMVAAIEAENHASIALHAGLGFHEVGLLPQVGVKFGRWLDLLLMQLDLSPGDSAPGDG